MKFSVRLSPADERRLEEMADKRCMTPSDLMRDMIRTGYDRQAGSEALKELKVAVASLGQQLSEAVQQISDIRSMLTRQGQSERIEPSLSIHEYKALKGIR